MLDLKLMCCDKDVLRINFNKGIFIIYDETLLPLTLKGYVKSINIEGTPTTQDKVVINRNNEAFTNWLASRTLTLSRSNSKLLYDCLKTSQVDSVKNRAKIAIICRAVSVLDNYWIKLDGDETTYANVNVRKISLNDIIAQVALHGLCLTIQGSLVSPEFTTNGAYAKAWRRLEDGLWLYKKGYSGDAESRIEVMCSNLLDKMSVYHCHYEEGYDNGYICKCPAMSSDSVSILSAMDFHTYCIRNDKNFLREALRVDEENMYKMYIVDYLLSNRDRHNQNWGFYYDARTNELLCCHPLFDHNNAFDLEWMQDRDAIYQVTDMSIRDSAKFAMERVDFHFTENISRDDFITERQYKEFMWRAKDLGIETYCTYEDKVVTLAGRLAVNKPIKQVLDLLPKVELDEAELHNALLAIKNFT